MTDQPLPEVFETPTAQPKNRKRPRVSLSLIIAIIALVISIASISASSEESQVNSVSKDPAGENDLFYPPADLPGLIAQVEQSIVDITCGESGGTGFAYSSDASEGYATVIVTNHHVIDECLEKGIDITKDYVPVRPVEHYLMGGIQVDLHGKTSMKGLYAVGETACNQTAQAFIPAVQN